MKPVNSGFNSRRTSFIPNPVKIDLVQNLRMNLSKPTAYSPAPQLPASTNNLCHQIGNIPSLPNFKSNAKEYLVMVITIINLTNLLKVLSVVV